MNRLRFFLPAIAMAAATAALAQSPTYQLGRTPTEEEIRLVDISIDPSGKQLPPGHGTAQEGAAIYAKKCAACHGKNGEGSKLAPRLAIEKGKYQGLVRWPFATSLWDYINRAMPRNLPVIGLREGTLSADEVYALTAFLLFRNDIVQETEVLDAKSLPRIRMPNRDSHLDRLAPLADDSRH